MTTLTKFAAAAFALGATAALLPAAAFAQDEETVVRGERSAEDPVGYVKFRDLNLGSDDGVAQLQARVRRTARSICFTGGHRDLALWSAEVRCRDAAMSSAAPQIAQAVERFRAGQFAALSPIAIVGTN